MRHLEKQLDKLAVTGIIALTLRIYQLLLILLSLFYYIFKNIDVK